MPKVKNFDFWKNESWIRPLNAKVRDQIHKKHRLWRKYSRNRDPAILGSINQHVMQLSKTLEKL